MLKWLAKKWALNDPLPEKADVIAVISYAATKDRLTNSSQKVMDLARNLSDRYPRALVAWGSFSKNSNNLEQKIKRVVLPNSLYVGQVSSSTDECEIIKLATSLARRSTQKIIVVSEGAHSRRCKRVWKYFFPKSEICFQSVPAWEAADEKNPMWFQRYWRVWFLINLIADFLAYRWKPVLEFMIRRNFSQPAS
ncbi:MAG: hypothetical protein V1896_00925 [Candidatus Zambryskibacteria bacterium]